MEQLTTPAYEFSAFVREKDGSVNEVSFAISQAQDSGEEDSVCTVCCGYLRAEPFRIYGVDDAQALELAWRFIEVSIRDRGLDLVDEKGHPTFLPPLSVPKP